MTRTSLTICLAAAMAVSVGCTSKNYVKQQTTPLINKTNELDDLTAKNSKVVRDYKLDPGKTVIYTPDGGQLEIITSSAASAEGALITFCVEDETEHWKPSNGGIELAEVIDRNLAKTSNRPVETSNAWEPGAGSV